MKKAIRVLLVDDNELVRYGVRRMLEQEEDIEVVGDYASVEEASCKMARLSPDIVLMGTQMPGMDGSKATKLAQVIREIYCSKQLSGDGDGFVEETVELVVPPLADAAQLLRFTYQLEKRLHDKNDNYASIMHTVGSWYRGIIITILLKPAKLSSLLDKLSNMPEVERMEEEPPAGDASSSFPKESGVLPRSGISPSKRIRVDLKETTYVA